MQIIQDCLNFSAKKLIRILLVAKAFNKIYIIQQIIIMIFNILINFVHIPVQVIFLQGTTFLISTQEFNLQKRSKVVADN